MALPTLLNVIVGLVVWATKRYQTSCVVADAQFGAFMFVVLTVAPYIVPAVLTQLVLEVNVTAPAQRLLTGASTIQILKVPAVLLFENILT